MLSTPVSLLEQLRGPVQPEPWARFAHLYTPLLIRWAARLGVPPGDRADFVQDVFLVLLRAMPDFAYRPGGTFRGWLYKVAANKWREVRRKRVPPTLPDPGRMDDLPGEADPAAAVDAGEYCAVLAAQAADLARTEFAPATWQAFWATVAEGRPPAAVAAELGVSVNSVYLARSRVLARLRADLAGLLD